VAAYIVFGGGNVLIFFVCVYARVEEYKVPIWFPLDPGPGASIGGMCACRCSGSTAVRYGSMRDNVLNVTAVLPDGQVIKTGSRARKCSAG
jgi:D-lactate dehydrogenase (cytochrome)